MEIKLLLKSKDGIDKIGFYLDGTHEVVIEAYQLLKNHFVEKGFNVIDPE